MDEIGIMEEDVIGKEKMQMIIAWEYPFSLMKRFLTRRKRLSYMKWEFM